MNFYPEKTLETPNSEFNYRLFLKGLDLVRRWETKLVCDQYKSRINFRNNISFVPFFIWRTKTVLIRLHSNSNSMDCYNFWSIRDHRTNRSKIWSVVRCFHRALSDWVWHFLSDKVWPVDSLVRSNSMPGSELDFYYRPLWWSFKLIFIESSVRSEITEKSWPE